MKSREVFSSLAFCALAWFTTGLGAQTIEHADENEIVQSNTLLMTQATLTVLADALKEKDNATLSEEDEASCKCMQCNGQQGSWQSGTCGAGNSPVGQVCKNNPQSNGCYSSLDDYKCNCPNVVGQRYEAVVHHDWQQQQIEGYCSNDGGNGRYQYWTISAFSEAGCKSYCELCGNACMGITMGREWQSQWEPNFCRVHTSDVAKCSLPAGAGSFQSHNGKGGSINSVVPSTGKTCFVPSAYLSGAYTIQQKANMRYMDAHVSSAYDVVTRGGQCDDSQKWLITPLGNGEYTIQQKLNMRYLDAHTKGNDYSVVTRSEQNDDSQKWLIKPRGSAGEYTIQQKENLRYMDAHIMANDYSVVTRTAQTDDSQKWLIAFAAAEYSKPAVKKNAMNPTFTLPVKCDMHCLHFATEKSPTYVDSVKDQTMCPKHWMVMATPDPTRWATWDHAGSECEIDNNDWECPSDEQVAEAGRVLPNGQSHIIFDSPGSDDDASCKTPKKDGHCFTCPTYDELVRLPDPWSDDHQATEDDPCSCEIDGCENGFVPCCVKRKELPCYIRQSHTPKNVYSLAEGHGLDYLIDLMKSAMIDAPPQSAFLAGWLGELLPILCDATVLDLTWPGTHDTGTYDLSDVVSKNPFGMDQDVWRKIGGQVVTATPEFVRLMGQAQAIDVIDQLNGGIRFIDFRIDFTHTNENVITGQGHSMYRKDDWFVMHGTQTKHPAIFHLAQMKAWLDRNPYEIIIIFCSHRGATHGSESLLYDRTLLTGNFAWPGASKEDKIGFWKQVEALFGDLLFDHSQGSLEDTPIKVMLARGQRVVWYSNDWVEFTNSSNRAINSASIDITSAGDYPNTGGKCTQNETKDGSCLADRRYTQREVFKNPLRDPTNTSVTYGPNTFRVFSMAAVTDHLMDSIYWARSPVHSQEWTACATAWQIPGMTDDQWCPLTLMDASMLVNYYNQETLEEAYQDPNKNFPHTCHIDMVDRGGMMRVGTKKFGPLGEVGEQIGENDDTPNAEGLENREAAYPFSATLVGKNIQRFCKHRKNNVECSKLTAIVEKERGDNPVKAWDDKVRGRHKCFVGALGEEYSQEHHNRYQQIWGKGSPYRDAVKMCR